nr:uncharacterized protein LOC112017559 [Quercus suber]
MKAEDALAVMKDVEKSSEKGRKEDNRRGRKRECSDHQTNDGDEHYLKWLRPLHSLPNVCDKKKYYRFHKDHGHHIEDCRNLKEQIKELIRKGKRQRFVKNRKHGRSKDNNKDKCDASLRDEDHTSQRLPSMIKEIKTIEGGPFARGSFRSLKKAYQRQGFNTRRILVDNGNSVDIIYFSAFQQLKLNLGRMHPFESPLISFSGDRVYSKGIVTLTVTVGSYPR